MAIRIEYLLMMVFAILLATFFGFNPHSKEAVTAKGQKEVEFEHFFANDIKEDNSGREISASKAVKYKQYIDFYNVKVSDELGHKLFAQKAIYKDDTLYMSQNVKLSRADGIKFYSKSLNYVIKDKVVITHEPFLLEFNKSIIKGSGFELKINQDTISAYNIDASIDFVKAQ